MAITVNTIFNFFGTPFKLKLIAGKKGLNKCVSWVYYTENPETIEFIRGGELAITTGLNLERKKWNEGVESENSDSSFLYDLINSFITHNASGLIINTGKYINTVPVDITEYCDSKNFPLFTMPWEIHTIDIMQDIGNMISAHNQNEHNIERLFYKAIFDNEDFDFKQIENTPYYETKNFSVALIELEDPLFNNDIEQLKRYISLFFNPKMNVQQDSFCSFIHKHKIIYIVFNDRSDFSKELVRIATCDKFFKKLRISFSDSSSDIKDLKTLYEHADIALKLGADNKQILHYDEMGIFRILVDVQNKRTLENIYNEVFGKLKSLEQEKREDYLKTLRLFLKFGGNMQMVSEANNIHRNTAIYRISRLEELLNVDLSDGDTRYLLQTALYIKELFAH